MEVTTCILDAVGLHQLRDYLLQNAQGGGETSLENLLPNRKTVAFSSIGYVLPSIILLLDFTSHNRMVLPA